MATSLRELIVSVSADTTKYQREMERASRMGGQYFKTVQQGSGDATRAWGTQTAAARTHANAIEASSQAITRYVAVAASAFGAGQLIGLADEWTNVSARVRLATESTSEFEHVQRRLKDIANATYRDYTEAADQFASTSRMMRELGFETEQTLDSAEALGLALVAGGANAQKGATALDAWGKSMSQGKIATEQWQTILLQTPRVAQALADGLGKTTAEMTRMAKDGQLTAQVVVPALTSQMGKLRDEVALMPTEFRDAGVRFRNELRAWVGEMNDTYGATQVLVKGIEVVAENIGTLATVGGAAALGALAGKMLQVSQAAAAVVVGSVRSRAAAIAETVAIRDATLAGHLKAQADLRRAQAAMSAVRGTAESTRASRNLAAALLTERQAALAAAQAQTAYARATNIGATAGRAALGILGGPAGLAVTVGMAAAGWLLFRDSGDSATAALLDMQGPLDEVLSKFRELNKEQQVGAILRLEDQIADAASELEGSFSRIVSAANSFGGEAARGFTPAVQSIIGEFKAGAIGADEFSARLSAVVNEMLDGSPAAAAVGRELKGLIASAAGSAVEIERSRERLTSFNGENSTAESQARGTAGAIRDQAGALDVLGAAADAAGKKISQALASLPGQIERVGKGAADVARLDVRDWFRGQAAGGLNFNNREDPAVQAALQQGAQYIRLQTQLAAAQAAQANATRANAAATKAANKEQTEAQKLAERLLEQYDDLAAAQDREIALHGKVGRAAALAYDVAKGALKDFTDAQKASLKESAEWLDWLDEMAAIDEVVADVAKDHAKYAEDASKKFGDMTVFAEQAARNIQDAFADFLFNPFEDGVSGMLESFGKALHQMAAQAVASRLFDSLGQWGGQNKGGGGWAGQLAGLVGSMFGTKAPGKAGGGHVRPHSMQDVTEHGPELLQYGGRTVLMMGATGGVVSPLMNKNGGGGAAGAGLQVVVNNNGSNKVSAREEQGRGPGGSMLKRLIIDVIADDTASGGKTAAATRGRFGLKEAM